MLALVREGIQVATARILLDRNDLGFYWTPEENVSSPMGSSIRSSDLEPGDRIIIEGEDTPEEDLFVEGITHGRTAIKQGDLQVYRNSLLWQT